MSLLMDALKKAEEEKKKAARRLEEVETETDPSVGDDPENQPDDSDSEDIQKPDKFKHTAELSLEPLASKLDTTVEEPATHVEPEATISDEEQREIPTVDATESFSDDLTLENASSPEVFEETQKDIDLSDTTIIEGLSSEDVSAPFDDTFHGVLIDDNEEPQSEAYEETLPGIPADQLAKDLGQSGYKTTPVAAQTVFSAGKPVKQSNNTFRWGVILVLGILAVSSFAVFYYFTITPVTRKMPSPMVARGIEAVPQPVPPITPVTEPGAVTGTIIDSESNVQLLPTEDTIVQVETETIYINDESVIESEQAQLEQVQEVDETDMDVVLSEDDVVYEEVKENTPTDELVSESNENAIDNSEDSDFTVPEEILQGNISLVDISKSKTIEKQDRYINEAFKAYKSGHLDAARSLYQDAIKKEPDNRDARLGLAAIAINDNDPVSAYSHYLHLLELNPKDAIALNALIALSNSSDPVADESAIKLLLRQEGNIPYLYFSLGNIYAKQQRWSEAQQAFFEAYRLDTSNPDYVHNMAISLDQLGKYATALDYYKTAIDLAQHSPAKFDTTIVKRRINKLNNLKESRL